MITTAVVTPKPPPCLVLSAALHTPSLDFLIICNKLQSEIFPLSSNLSFVSAYTLWWTLSSLKDASGSHGCIRGLSFFSQRAFLPDKKPPLLSSTPPCPSLKKWADCFRRLAWTSSDSDVMAKEGAHWMRGERAMLSPQ